MTETADAPAAQKPFWSFLLFRFWIVSGFVLRASGFGLRA
jgi:hypothetical protein